MNIAFEGCDKAGKTSLIREFVRRRKEKGEDWPVVKFSSPQITKTVAGFWRSGAMAIHPVMQAEMLSEYFATFKLMKAVKLDRLVLDRFFLGEFVYCALRGYAYSTEEEDYWLRRFEKLCGETRTVLVYVKASGEEILSRMAMMGGDEYTPASAVAKILSRYDQLVCRYSFMREVVEVDTTGKTAAQSCDELERALDAAVFGPADIGG